MTIQRTLTDDGSVRLTTRITRVTDGHGWPREHEITAVVPRYTSRGDEHIDGLAPRWSAAPDLIRARVEMEQAALIAAGYPPRGDFLGIHDEAMSTLAAADRRDREAMQRREARAWDLVRASNAHEHVVTSSSDRPFTGPVVVVDENRAAHGNICRVERCACGAERHTNINGRHVEEGRWLGLDVAEARRMVAAD